MHEFRDKPLRVAGERAAVHYWRLLLWLINLRVVPRRHEGRAGPVAGFCRGIFHDGLTRFGKAVLIAGCLVYFCSHWFPGGYYPFVTSFAFSALLVSAAAGFVYRPRVLIRRETPRTAVAGETAVSSIIVTNCGPRPLYNFSAREMTVPGVLVHREWELSHHGLLGANEECSMPVPFTARRRGVVDLYGIAVQSFFPFFLTRACSKMHSRATVFIMPTPLNAQLPPLRHMAERTMEKKAAGLRQGRAIDSHEYAYSRQFQTGDSVRRIDQRASGRRGEPMSKVFEGVSRNRLDRLHIIVDTSLRSFKPWQPRPGSTDVLDRRLALVLELFHRARNENMRIDSAAWAGEWKHIPTSLALYGQIASCRATRTLRLPDSLPDPKGLYAVVLGGWSSVAHDAVSAWIAGGALVLVFLMPETDNDSGMLPPGKNFIEVRE